MAFQKASTVVATKGGKRDRPDVEDAFEDSDDGEIIEDLDVEDDNDNDDDITKDRMIKEKKPKGKSKSVSASSKKTTAKKEKK
jgi:replication factor C subunit 1